MSEKFQVAKPIYPLISVLCSICVFVFGLVNAASVVTLYALIAIWALLFIYGYYKACIAILPVAVVLGVIFAGITYAATSDWKSCFAAVNRILAVVVAVIPGLALQPVCLTRCLSAIKFPRSLTLGMMIAVSFFPLLSAEIRQIREAMKTRGVSSIWRPQLFYRAFLIPLVMRLVNISDTLALSVETRAFTSDKSAYSVYRIVKLSLKDIVFLAILILVIVLAVIL